VRLVLMFLLMATCVGPTAPEPPPPPAGANGPAQPPGE